MKKLFHPDAGTGKYLSRQQMRHALNALLKLTHQAGDLLLQWKNSLEPQHKDISQLLAVSKKGIVFIQFPFFSH